MLTRTLCHFGMKAKSGAIIGAVCRRGVSAMIFGGDVLTSTKSSRVGGAPKIWAVHCALKNGPGSFSAHAWHRAGIVRHSIHGPCVTFQAFVCVKQNINCQRVDFNKRNVLNWSIALFFYARCALFQKARWISDLPTP